MLISKEEVLELAAAVEAVIAPYRRADRAAPPEGAVTFAASFILAQDQAGH